MLPRRETVRSISIAVPSGSAGGSGGGGSGGGWHGGGGGGWHSGGTWHGHSWNGHGGGAFWVGGGPWWGGYGFYDNYYYDDGCWQLVETRRGLRRVWACGDYY